MGGCVQIVCKFHAILPKGLGYLWILVYVGVLKPTPSTPFKYEGITVI